MKKTNKSSAGTSFYNHTVWASRAELTEALGAPTTVGTLEEKVQYEWERETDQGDVFTIYDWKEYAQHSAAARLVWHIGAQSAAAGECALRETESALSALLSEDIYTDADTE